MAWTLEQIPTAFLRNKVVILDIDGTLVPDDSEIIPVKTRAWLKQACLSAKKIYLATNSRNNNRNSRLAAAIGLPVLSAQKRKPRPSFLVSLSADEKTQATIIGDKYITDGLLGWFSGTPWLIVSRNIGQEDRLLVRLAYTLDWLVGITIKILPVELTKRVRPASVSE